MKALRKTNDGGDARRHQLMVGADISAGSTLFKRGQDVFIVACGNLRRISSPWGSGENNSSLILKMNAPADGLSRSIRNLYFLPGLVET
jgi:hypothetical protein